MVGRKACKRASLRFFSTDVAANNLRLFLFEERQRFERHIFVFFFHFNFKDMTP